MGIRRRLTALALFMAIVSVLSACGSNGGGTGTDSTGAGGQPTAALKKIQAEVESLEKRPTSIGLKTPISKSIPAAKTIDYLQCGVPDCVALGEHLEEAAKVIGWNVDIVDIGLTPEEVKAGWEQAVRNNPDAVIGTGGFPAQIYQSELNSLLSAHIPVISVTDGSPPKGTFAVSGPDRFKLIGQNVAKWVIAKTNGDANVLFANVPAFTVQSVMEEAFDEEFEADCPSCTLSHYDAPATAIGKDLAGNIAQRVQANPGINYLVLGFNDMATGLPEALRNVGITDLPAVTQGQGEVQSAYVKNGEMLEAMYALPGTEMMWRCVDLFIRYFNGESTAEDTDGRNFPKWFITQETVPSTTSEYPVVADYQKQYEALWGLK